MKKTYIAPAFLAVQLGAMHMMAESLPVGTTTITSQDAILTKEDNSTISDVNLWDNEW